MSECNGPVRVAMAPHFEIQVTSVQCVTQCRRWLRRSPEAEHAFGSTPHTRAYQPPWHARQTYGSYCRKCSRGTWWTYTMIALNVLGGKPLGFGRQPHGATAPRGCA